MRQRYPEPAEYRNAIQHPRLAFADPDLKFAECEEDHWGLPRIMTGGFAAIFHLHKGKSQWAVRCFYKDVPELRRRYEAIGQFLSKRPDEVFVDASLLHDGILVQGQRYPIIKMTWIDGDPLNLYIESNISKRQAISWLPDAFLELTERLQKLGIAHGDLQHGNIMVTDHSLKLIDYDGIFLPELKGLPNNQQGHPNYQLPSRTDEYGPEIDRFSEVVIYTALKALAESPSLWKKYSKGGENLLFKQNDFVDPDSSELMSDLEQISDLGSLVPKLRVLCALGIEDMPALEDFLSGRWHPSTVVPPPIRVIREVRTIFEVLEASDTAGLLARVGLRVTVVGQITAIHEDSTRYGQPYVFLNFGDWKRKCFHLVAWSGALTLFAAEGLRISSYKGKWISITGILSSFKSTPQIEVEMPSQIEVLSGSHEASNRLKGILSPKAKKSVDSTRVKARDMMKARVLNYVVAHRDEYPSASTISMSLGVGPGMLKDLLDELVREGNIKRNDLTTGLPVKPGAPPGFFPTSGGTRGSGPSGAFTRREVDILKNLYGKPTVPTPSPTPPQQPISTSLATKMIPSPNLFTAGVLLVALSLLLAFLRTYVASLFLAILGGSVVYYALTHYSILVPVQVTWPTLTSARFRAYWHCKGCHGMIQAGEAIVMTERGWMHSQCAGTARKRAWKGV